MAPPTQPQRNARPIIPTPISPMTLRPENVPVPPSVGVTRRQNSTVPAWPRESRQLMCTLNILAERVVKMSLRVILLPTPVDWSVDRSLDATSTPAKHPLRSTARFDSLPVTWDTYPRLAAGSGVRFGRNNLVGRPARTRARAVKLVVSRAG